MEGRMEGGGKGEGGRGMKGRRKGEGGGGRGKEGKGILSVANSGRGKEI